MFVPGITSHKIITIRLVFVALFVADKVIGDRDILLTVSAGNHLFCP
jgi:hypothetical protein